MENSIQEIVASCPAKALNYIVIIKEIENKNETSFGFDTSNLADKNEKYRRAIIVSLGPSCPKDDENPINVGDTVMYDHYKTSPLTLNGIEFKTLMWGDLICSV